MQDFQFLKNDEIVVLDVKIDQTENGVFVVKAISPAVQDMQMEAKLNLPDNKVDAWMSFNNQPKLMEVKFELQRRKVIFDSRINENKFRFVGEVDNRKNLINIEVMIPMISAKLSIREKRFSAPGSGNYYYTRRNSQYIISWDFSSSLYEYQRLLVPKSMKLYLGYDRTDLMRSSINLFANGIQIFKYSYTVLPNHVVFNIESRLLGEEHMVEISTSKDGPKVYWDFKLEYFGQNWSLRNTFDTTEENFLFESIARKNFEKFGNITISQKRETRLGQLFEIDYSMWATGSGTLSIKRQGDELRITADNDYISKKIQRAFGD